MASVTRVHLDRDAALALVVVLAGVAAQYLATNRGASPAAVRGEILGNVTVTNTLCGTTTANGKLPPVNGRFVEFNNLLMLGVFGKGAGVYAGQVEQAPGVTITACSGGPLDPDPTSPVNAIAGWGHINAPEDDTDFGGSNGLVCLDGNFDGGDFIQVGATAIPTQNTRRPSPDGETR